MLFRSLTKYDRKRLLKPIDLKEIYTFLENIDSTTCKYQDSEGFSNIKPYLDDLLRSYQYYKFDKQNNLIYKIDTHNNSYVLQEQIKIHNLLDKYHINHTLLNNMDIQIDY